MGDFSQGLTLNEKLSEQKVDETYELPNIKQSKVHYVANEAVFSFLKENKASFDVVFRVSNNDQLNGKVISTRLNKNQEIELSIPGNGGALIVK